MFRLFNPLTNRLSGVLHRNMATTVENLSALVITGNYANSGNIQDALQVHGNANIGDNNVVNQDTPTTTCEKEITVNGNFKAFNSKFLNVVTSNGGFESRYSIFTKPVTARGNINISDSKFNDSLQVSGKTKFSNSQLNSIKVSLGEPLLKGIPYAQKWFSYTPEIVLNDTIVENDISFPEGNPGRVTLQGTSEVKGEVINGEIISNNMRSGNRL